MRLPYGELNRLVRLLQSVPGVGDRSALKMALFFAEMGPKRGRELASLILKVVDDLSRCPECGNLAEDGKCWICADPERDTSVLMLVETVLDLLVMEEAGYRGIYQVVAGLVPSTRRIREDVKSRALESVLSRVDRYGVREVILGFPYTVRGEALTRFFSAALRGRVPTISRLARGIPTGGEVEFMDSTTLSFSLSRRERL